MRPVLHGDIADVARALLGVSPERRAQSCRDMINEADTADRFVQTHKRMHPMWGNGSLMSAARMRVLSSEPDFDDQDYCDCVALVLAELRKWRISRTHS